MNIYFKVSFIFPTTPLSPGYHFFLSSFQTALSIAAAAITGDITSLSVTAVESGAVLLREGWNQVSLEARHESFLSIFARTASKNSLLLFVIAVFSSSPPPPFLFIEEEEEKEEEEEEEWISQAALMVIWAASAMAL
jgi:hypothetical protein